MLWQIHQEGAGMISSVEGVDDWMYETMHPGKKRIRTAERLRKQAKTESSDEVYLWNHLEVAVNGWTNDGDSHPVYDELHVHYQDVYVKLADLIDPKAHPCGMDSLGMPPYYMGHMHVNDSVEGCPVCGYPYGKEIYNLPGRFPRIPNYCPCCGTRISYLGGKKAGSNLVKANHDKLGDR